jgi:hypothetical protein
MSKLEQFARPFETFDPTNKQHRAIFHAALKNRSWGMSPIRFWLIEETTSLMDQCTKNMARYYMEKEFGKIDEKTTADEIKRIKDYKEGSVDPNRLTRTTVGVIIEA